MFAEGSFKVDPVMVLNLLNLLRSAKFCQWFVDSYNRQTQRDFQNNLLELLLENHMCCQKVYYWIIRKK